MAPVVNFFEVDLQVNVELLNDETNLSPKTENEPGIKIKEKNLYLLHYE